jgi:hypothetical protein
MTDTRNRRYSPLLMEGWQSKAAFVVQFREGTDVEAGRLDGKVEHIASYRATRFHSVDELMAFIAQVLTEIRGLDEPKPSGADWT